ncbi:MAG: response regulator receiver protein [Verrucomicrobiales bacterium]|nr:response regulator receiver protein [Verrucomicrobiales bacterium]
MKTRHFSILVVEDDEDDRFLIESAFRKAGVTAPINLVCDGGEAIAYLNGEGKFADRDKYQYPTFIMTDLKMPNGDGYMVLENLKKNPAWTVIPTVVFSASTDQDDIKKAYMLGASSYHLKPSTQDEMRAQLKLIYDYWMTCQTPQVDITGKQIPTEGAGKLGERFVAPVAGEHEKRDA